MFAVEWRAVARRQTLYAVRALAVAVLLAALTVARGLQPDSQESKNPAQRQKEYAELGSFFAEAAIGAQLALLLLAAPAAAAGAVCLDKQRGNLLHLFVTDLTSAEIVLGKLVACLLPVLGLLLGSVPVLCATTWLGGVDPEALASSFLVGLGTAVLGCALAFLLSVWFHRPHEVLLAVYLLEAAVLLADPVWDLIAALTVRVGPPAWVTALNPFVLAFAPFTYGGPATAAECGRFLTVALGLAAACTLLAIVSLRPVVLRQAGGAARPTARRIGWRGRRLLDRNPVLWYELHRKRPTRGARLTWAAYRVAAVGLLATALIVIPHSHSLPDFRVPVFGWNEHFGAIETAVSALFAVGLLLVLTSAATALADERARGGLDVLLVTPLPTWRIVGAKWRAAFRPVPWMMLPALVMVLLMLLYPAGWWWGQARPDLRPRAAVLIVGVMLAYGAAAVSLGLVLATAIRAPGRALTAAVSIAGVVALFAPFVILTQTNGVPIKATFVASPAGGITVLSQLLSYERRMSIVQPTLAVALGCVVVYGAAALALYLLTLALFDHCLGRASGRRRPALPDVPEAVSVPGRAFPGRRP